MKPRGHDKVQLSCLSLKKLAIGISQAQTGQTTPHFYGGKTLNVGVVRELFHVLG